MPTLLPYLPAAQDLHIDLDKYLNKIIPPSPLHRLPRPFRRFLGCRESAVPDVGNILVAFWALIGTFAGLVLVTAIFRYSPWIEDHRPPVLIASLGAAAILEYNAIASPLAQPRNALFGHGLSALVGVLIAKAFNNYGDYDDLRWITGPLACGLASAAMTLTNTVHPPGGATAVLAVLDPTVHSLGWLFLPFVLIGCALMIAVALLLNNIQRQYPVYWWTPLETGSAWKRTEPHKVMDVENFSMSTSYTLSGSVQCMDTTASAVEESIILSSNGLLSVPSDFYLDDRERALLEKLLAKLQATRLGSHTTDNSWTGPHS